MSVQTVSRRLGHASANITLGTYSHLYPGDDQDAADLFAQLLDPNHQDPDGTEGER